MNLAGVQTTYAHLPHTIPTNIPQASGIIMEEVLHWKSKKHYTKILVTGDTLAMTACSPHMKTLHQMSQGYVQFVQ